MKPNNTPDLTIARLRKRLGKEGFLQVLSDLAKSNKRKAAVNENREEAQTTIDKAPLLRQCG